MKPNGSTVDEILSNLPPDRMEPFNQLHQVIIKNLPKGFESAISYGGLGYVIPHKLYPAGYHCKPVEPLPFAMALNRMACPFTPIIFMESASA